ncbi:hypothetical protein ANN_14296 [Periplaneta americana]|uniref:Uncharacterized protein n=1 Tax=Periplaneta americana TaxID=6978 RepID=A0ABQ8SVX6_PERAM|nr:hypothetical protein ANN_14296 [Periplaneta americana]
MAGLCESGNEPPGSLKPVPLYLTTLQAFQNSNYGLFNDARNCRGYISVAGVPEF